MARFRLSLLPVLALLATGCDRQPTAPQASVTVRLPPARPAPARPAFPFKPRSVARSPAG